MNATCKEINSACKESKMSLAQIHFEANESLFAGLDLPYLRAIRATCKEDILKHEDEYRIVDAFVESYGGEGKRVDISWFDFVDCSKIILAGGLSCSNVEEVKDLNFYGLDVSSGVEISKGKKDKNKIREFLQRAKK